MGSGLPVQRLFHKPVAEGSKVHFERKFSPTPDKVHREAATERVPPRFQRPTCRSRSRLKRSISCLSVFECWLGHLYLNVQLQSSSSKANKNVAYFTIEIIASLCYKIDVQKLWTSWSVTPDTLILSCKISYHKSMGQAELSCIGASMGKTCWTTHQLAKWRELFGGDWYC